MILLKLNNEKVVGVYLDVNPNHEPQIDEVLIETIEVIELQENERGYMYYRNGKVEIEKKEV
jgi:hypothetical protein